LCRRRSRVCPGDRPSMLIRSEGAPRMARHDRRRALRRGEVAALKITRSHETDWVGAVVLFPPKTHAGFLACAVSVPAVEDHSLEHPPVLTEPVLLDVCDEGREVGRVHVGECCRERMSFHAAPFCGSSASTRTIAAALRASSVVTCSSRM